MPRITKIESKKEKKKLRVAAYCRVSTSQDAQMESLEAQKEHYDQVIKSNEDWVYVGLYYQKTFTDNNLVRHKNHGDCDQYHHQGTHEAIVSEEQFNRVQDIMSQRKKERRIDSEEHDNKKKYVMTKKLICEECGSNMRRIKIQGRTSGTYIAWGCAKHCLDPDACHQKSVEEENIKVAFITLTNKLIFSKRELLEPFVDALQKSDIADVSEINQKLEGNMEKLNTLLSLAADGLIDPAILHRAQSELMENNAELNSRKKVLLQQIHGKNEAAAEAEMLLSRVKKMRVSDQFDEPFFRDCVRKAHVYSRQEFGFELNCGLLLKERLK